MGAQIVEHRSDYLPTVNAVAGYSALGTGLPVANNFNVGIEITWPIFNSFLISHQVAGAELHCKAIDAQIEDLRQRIIVQVETAFQNWQASFLRISRAERTLAASRDGLHLAEKRYAAGLSDVVELEDAERDYTADGVAYANARSTGLRWPRPPWIGRPLAHSRDSRASALFSDSIERGY
jgi:outer membrane protein